MKKTVAYMRVSTEAQTEGNGIDQQRMSIAAYVLQRSIKIDEWVEEAETGTTEDREQIQALLTRARKGEIGMLILDRVDRLGRLAHVTLKLRDDFEAAGVDLVFAQQHFDKTHAGEFVFTLFSGLAEYNRKEILLRMKQARIAAVRKNGTWYGGPIPYGYRKLGNGRLAEDPRSADMVRMVFDLRAKGHTLASITLSLKLGGYVTKTGKRFHEKQIALILSRERIYRGEQCFGKQALNPGVVPAHPAILKTETPLMHVKQRQSDLQAQ